MFIDDYPNNKKLGLHYENPILRTLYIIGEYNI